MGCQVIQPARVIPAGVTWPDVTNIFSLLGRPQEGGISVEHFYVMCFI